MCIVSLCFDRAFFIFYCLSFDNSLTSMFSKYYLSMFSLCVFVCVFVCLYLVCNCLSEFLFVYIQLVNVCLCFCLSIFSLSIFGCVFVCLYSVCQCLSVFLFVYIQFVNVWVCFCLSLFSLSMFFCVLVCLYSVCQCLSVFLLVCFWFEVNAFININAQYGELSFSRKFNLFIKILLTNVKKYTINSNK